MSSSHNSTISEQDRMALCLLYQTQSFTMMAMDVRPQRRVRYHPWCPRRGTPHEFSLNSMGRRAPCTVSTSPNLPYRPWVLRTTFSMKAYFREIAVVQHLR